MSSLRPAESMALTVALAQVLRGEEPMPNVATVCVLALARLTDRHDYEAAIDDMNAKGEAAATALAEWIEEADHA